MVEAHGDIREMNPLNEVAFHTLAYHVPTAMLENEAGGPEERDAVLDILYSLKDDVMGDPRMEFEKTEVPLWERLGGSEDVKSLSEKIYEKHATDPLTQDWFPEKDASILESMKTYIFDFISEITNANQHHFISNAMTFGIPSVTNPLSKVAVHGLVQHFMVAMYESGIGAREREEMLNLLYRSREAAKVEPKKKEEL